MKKIFLPIFCLTLALAGCAGEDRPYNTTDFANGGDDAPLYNERTSTFMQPDNQYAGIDSYRPKTEAEKEEKNKRWNTSRMETRWQEYKGAMVRVQILLGNSDLREMRLQRGYNLLLSTTKSVSEIAFEVGFNTPSYFSNCFKKQFGKYPTDLRAEQ